MSRIRDRILVLIGMLRLVGSVLIVLVAFSLLVRLALANYLGFGSRESMRIIYSVTDLLTPFATLFCMISLWCLFGPLELSSSDVQEFYRHPFKSIRRDLRRSKP